MRRTTIALIVASLTLSGCARIADSQLNPLNWFGSAEPTANLDASGNLRPLVREGELSVVADSRGLISSVTALSINRTPDGAIVQATGQTEAQGYYNAELVPVSQDGRTLTLAFRVSAPESPTTGTQTITAAYVLSNSDLAGISQISVQGRSNTLTTRR